MPAQYERPVRRIDVPTLVLLRQLHTHYDAKHRQLPIDRVPLEKRTGALTVILSVQGLAIKDPQTEDVYPVGAGFEYKRGCEVFLEVFPRGYSQEDYIRWQRAATTRVVPMAGVRTPLYVSYEASLHLNGVSRPGRDGLSQMRLLRPEQLMHYLTGTLPLLGVGPEDVAPTVQHVRTLLLRGKGRLDERSARRDRR